MFLIRIYLWYGPKIETLSDYDSSIFKDIYDKGFKCLNEINSLNNSEFYKKFLLKQIEKANV